MTTSPLPSPQPHDTTWLAERLRQLGLTDRQQRMVLLDAGLCIAWHIEQCARPDDRWKPVPEVENPAIAARAREAITTREDV